MPTGAIAAAVNDNKVPLNPNYYCYNYYSYYYYYYYYYYYCYDYYYYYHCHITITTRMPSFVASFCASRNAIVCR